MTTDEALALRELVERIVRECPRRAPGTESERRAQEILRHELERAGLRTEWQPFRYHGSLHSNLALHFGLGVAGTLVGGVAPALGALLHGLGAASYWHEATRRGAALRALLPEHTSQNLIATLPAEGPETKLRVVFLAHVDAAFTGLLFRPDLVRRTTRGLPTLWPPLRRPIALAMRLQAALAGLNLLRAVVGPLGWPLRPLEVALTLPSLMITAANLEIMLRDEVVPGAADNLSGAAALPLLAHRLAAKRPPGLELVFVATGAEEPQYWGADALERAMDGVWERERTVVLALDTLGNGELRAIEVEGDAVRLPAPRWLTEAAHAVAASDARFDSFEGMEVPVGGSDATAFVGRGWHALALTRIDPAQGSSLHYHTHGDHPGNLDYAQVLESLDFTEQLVQRIVELRLR